MASFLRKKLGRFWRYEIAFVALIVAYVYANIEIITELPSTVLDTIIIQIVPVYITVEGVLIGLAPQIKTKWLRDGGVVLGITSMLLAVRTLIVATYQHLQLNQLSLDATTTGFVFTSFLFPHFRGILCICYPQSCEHKTRVKPDPAQEALRDFS